VGLEAAWELVRDAGWALAFAVVCAAGQVVGAWWVGGSLRGAARLGAVVVTSVFGSAGGLLAAWSCALAVSSAWAHATCGPPPLTLAEAQWAAAWPIIGVTALGAVAALYTGWSARPAERGGEREVGAQAPSPRKKQSA
jgi:hypothetical protein